jgi:hypothetical protein
MEDVARHRWQALAIALPLRLDRNASGREHANCRHRHGQHCPAIPPTSCAGRRPTCPSRGTVRCMRGGSSECTALSSPSADFLACAPSVTRNAAPHDKHGRAHNDDDDDDDDDALLSRLQRVQTDLPYRRDELRVVLETCTRSQGVLGTSDGRHDVNSEPTLMRCSKAQHVRHCRGSGRPARSPVHSYLRGWTRRPALPRQPLASDTPRRSGMESHQANTIPGLQDDAAHAVGVLHPTAANDSKDPAANGTPCTYRFQSRIHSQLTASHQCAQLRI